MIKDEHEECPKSVKVDIRYTEAQCELRITNLLRTKELYKSYLEQKG